MSNIIPELNKVVINTMYIKKMQDIENNRLMLKQLKEDKVKSIPKETKYIFDELFNFLELDKKNITSFYYKHHTVHNYSKGRFTISYPHEINKIRTFYYNDELKKGLMFLSTNITYIFKKKSYELRKLISF